MATQDRQHIEEKRAAVVAARQEALEAKAHNVCANAQAKADKVRRKAECKAKHIIAKGEAKAAKLEGIVPQEVERKVRLDVHGREKPLLRGWLHAGATPLALAAGIVLICIAHGTGLKWACAVFMTASLILFGNSAAYHLGDWSPRVTDVLRRIDHMNIFLLIAGTYTPFWLVWTGGGTGIACCAVFWAAAVFGITMVAVFGPGRMKAPHMTLYIVMGWSGLVFLPGMVRDNLPLFLTTLGGGLLYTLGIIPFALKKKGAHFIWHFFVLFGAALHWIGIYLFLY